ncbi:MAG TPA: nuclease-related domain-containing protein [Anaerolineae bacterium]|nr:nuclease-related domain-containing protein [Anaerolineae bacterium]
MAEQLADKGSELLDSLAVYLCKALPDEYALVCGPIVRGQQLGAVVVGPQGLIVLHTKDWQGEIRPSQHGVWQERLPSGRVVSHPNPGREVHSATKALRAFLRDEFPSLHPMIHHFVVLTKPGVKLMAHQATDPPCRTTDDLPKEILALGPPPEKASLASETREVLAQALLDRRLTATERASQPFIFRSSEPLGIGKKAWTIRQLIRHIDRRPDDGVHHLRNGTLERWFDDQGAVYLATLAREVMRQSEKDPRVPLESFLLRSGLVRRPRLAILPKRVDLGRVLSGETVRRRLRMRKGRGRGYLFGTVQPSDPWMRVAPDTFSGSLDAIVSVDTESLLIRRNPYRATILVSSSASNEPIRLPVVVRVASKPSALSRCLLRPLAGCIVAGLLGAGVGWSLGGAGTQPPSWLTRLTAPPVPSRAAWALLTGVFWALLGMLRGFWHHPAWSIAHAMGRWLLKTLIWGAVLSFLTGAGLWFAGKFYADMAVDIPETVRASIIFFAVALAALPSTAGEMWAARPKDPADASSKGRMLRWALSGAILVALVFVVTAGIRLAGPGWDWYGLDSRVGAASQWVGERWTRWEARLNDWVDQLYVRYYDPSAQSRLKPTAPADPSSAEKHGVAWPWGK